MQFKHLAEDTILRIVDKELRDLHELLIEKEVELEITPAAKQWLAEKGYDRQMGARPMSRLIQEQLKKPLAEELLFGQLSNNGGCVTIDIAGDEVTIEVTGKVTVDI